MSDQLSWFYGIRGDSGAMTETCGDVRRHKNWKADLKKKKHHKRHMERYKKLWSFCKRHQHHDIYRRPVVMGVEEWYEDGERSTNKYKR